VLSSVTVEVVEEKPLAVVKFRATPENLTQKIGEALAESAVYKAIGSLHYGLNTIVYHPSDDGLNVELGVQMDVPFEGTDTVKRSITPAGRVVRVVHTGPYSELGQAHEAIQSWRRENGEALEGTSWEIYGHWNDDPAKLETTVFYLTEPR